MTTPWENFEKNRMNYKNPSFFDTCLMVLAVLLVFLLFYLAINNHYEVERQAKEICFSNDSVLVSFDFEECGPRNVVCASDNGIKTFRR